MKHKLFPWSPIALAVMMVGILFLGCPNPEDPGQDPPAQSVDNPAEGIMSKETASKVFKWENVSGGVEIVEFLSTGALKQYLTTTVRAAELDIPLVIKKIDGKPVIAIRDRAFKATDSEGNYDPARDITLVVGKVELPPTIESLGEDLFEGAAGPVELAIPPEITENPAIDLETAVGDAEVTVVDSETGDAVELKSPPVDIEEPGDPNVLPGAPAPVTVNLGTITGLEGPGANGSIVGATIITSTQFTGTVTWNPALSGGVFDAGKLYTATITLTPKSGYTFGGVGANFFTVGGAKTTNAANSGVVTAVFPGIRADDVSSLNSAVTAAKDYSGGGAVIYLSSAFYSAAGTVIVVDAGSTDNSVPYTIKGTGKNSGDTLSVGIFLANDNVSLEGVQISITDSTKAAPTNWSYGAGISIARSANGFTPLAGADMASKNVTVKDSSISFVGNGSGSYPWVSGIYLSASSGVPSTNITITGNTIDVTGYGGYAAQAIGVARYVPSIVINGNNLTSCNTASTDAWDAPASALYMNIDPRNISDGDTPNISGNTLSGTFDFYVAIRSVGNYVGIPSLFSNNFGTANSTWVGTNTTDTGLYKKLFDALLPQARSNGYGLFYMIFSSDLGGGGNGKELALEQYEITSGKVTAIDYWGPAISSSSIYDIQGKDIAVPGQGYRDRITVNGTPDPSSIGSNTFHWTRTLQGSDL
jgi:hypothetical protein